MTVALLLGSVVESFAPPECEGSPLTGTPTDTSSWDNCEGIIIYNLSGFVGDKYVGEYRNGKKNEQGTFTYARSGNKFVGEFRDGKPNGQGTGTWDAPHEFAGQKYVGEIKDGKRHGQGTATFDAPHEGAGEKYIGEFRENEFSGRGVYIFPNGDRFTGLFEKGLAAEGTMQKADGATAKMRQDELGNWIAAQ